MPAPPDSVPPPSPFAPPDPEADPPEPGSVPPDPGLPARPPVPFAPPVPVQDPGVSQVALSSPPQWAKTASQAIAMSPELTARMRNGRCICRELTADRERSKGRTFVSYAESRSFSRRAGPVLELQIRREAGTAERVKGSAQQLLRRLWALFVMTMLAMTIGAHVLAKTPPPKTKKPASRAAPAPRAAPRAAPKPTPPPKTAPPPKAGEALELTHEPASEQAVLTPLPIWVDVKGDPPSKMVVKYKGLGDKTWKSLNLSQIEAGWGAELSCRDIGTVTGVFRYYIVAYDADGEEITTSGSSQKPYKVKIRRSTKVPPQPLPGRPTPTKCTDPTDCPPDFPGCTSSKGDQDSCASNEDCDEGMACTDQKCAAPGSTTTTKDNLVTVAGSGEFAMIRDLDYCWLDKQYAADYWCKRDDGQRYVGNPLPDTRATTSYGPAAARVVLGYDRFLGKHFALGLRAGVTVWGMAPALEDRAKSLPILAELRMGYWFTRESTVRPFVFLSGGYAPTDYRFRVLVDEDTSLPSDQPDNPESQILTAYHHLGPYYGGLGLGMLFALSPTVGIVFDVQGLFRFPRKAWGVAPELGMAFGF
jgi:hypothetical protein